MNTSNDYDQINFLESNDLENLNDNYTIFFDRGEQSIVISSTYTLVVYREALKCDNNACL